jgi:dTDP-glucose 4,6-dehydratase
VGHRGTAISVRALAERLIRLFPEKQLRLNQTPSKQPLGYVPNTIHRLCPDTAKLEALGWRPRHDIESGFRRTVRSFETHVLRNAG